ncbi:MAG: AMP-binding protein, partial [Sphingobium sp.]
MQLFAVLLSTHLKPSEAAHILNDSGARMLITSADVGETALVLAADRGTLIPDVGSILSAGPDPLPGARPFYPAITGYSTIPIADERSGFYIIYSSGTTGLPKGIMLPFTPGTIHELSPVEGSWQMYAAFD